MANSYPVATGVPVNECPEFASSEAGSFLGGEHGPHFMLRGRVKKYYDRHKTKSDSRLSRLQ